MTKNATSFKKGHKGYKYWLGKKLSKETKKKMSIAMTGKKQTEEHIRKRTASLRSSNSGKNNSSWKGDSVGYRAIHYWVSKYRKKPDSCPECNLKKSLDWANIDHKYSRNLDDYIALCRKCHFRFDRERKEREN